MRFKKSVMNESDIRRALIRMSHEIIEKNRGADNLFIIGIHKRGLPLANEIAQIIKAVEGKDIPVGSLDITLYRDDLSLVSEMPTLNGTNIPFSITDAEIILVDDVLYTGRTTRAAMDAIIENGRPKSIQLAVLIDRGNRELPIGADYVGKFVPTSHNEVISVNIKEIDGKCGVDIFSME